MEASEEVRRRQPAVSASSAASDSPVLTTTKVLSPTRLHAGITPRKKVRHILKCPQATFVQFVLMFVMVVLPNLILIWFLGARERYSLNNAPPDMLPRPATVRRIEDSAGRFERIPDAATGEHAPDDHVEGSAETRLGELSPHSLVAPQKLDQAANVPPRIEGAPREVQSIDFPEKEETVVERSEPTKGQPDEVIAVVRERPELSSYLNRIQKTTYWSVSNLCFNSTNKMFVASQGALALLPQHIRENKQFQQQAPKVIRESSVGKRVRGTTVIGRDMHLDQTGAHFYFFMLPMASLLKHAIHEKPLGEVSLAFDRFDIPKEHTLENQFGEIVFKDVPEDRRISLSSLSDPLTCFDEVVSVGIDYSAMVRGASDLDYLKANAGKVEMQEFVEDCASPKANKGVVGILNRRVFSRKVENIRQLKVATRQVFGDSVDIMVFDSPNVACEGTPCLGYTDCSLLFKENTNELKKTCRTTRAVADDIRVFNNLTFLISVHGAANMNYVWLPHGAHVVEIFPFAISDYTYKQISEVSNMKYTAFQDQNRTLFDTNFPTMKEGAECWKDNACRKFMKAASVHVTVDGPHGIKKVLYQQLASWRERCKVLG